MTSHTIADNSVETLKQFIADREEPEWMKDLRKLALDRYAGMEWPTRQDEEFRRSDVSNYEFEDLQFEIVDGPAAQVENPVGLSGQVVFNNTAVTRRSLSAGLEEKGVVFISFQEAWNQGLPEKLQKQVADAIRAGIEAADHRISVWHYVTMTHGAVLYVPEFVELTEPFVATFEESGDEVLRSPHLVVIGDQGARFPVVHRNLGSEDGEVIFTEGVDIVAGDAGSVAYYGLQNVNIDSSYFSQANVTVGRDARAQHYATVFGGMFAKHRVDLTMAGAGSDGFLGGVYFPLEDQHVDLRTVQKHAADHAHSDTLFKGAVMDEAHSVYQGLIDVDRNAVQTDAYLTNNNLLLSDESQADSIPTLQINTDDVRCSHGSTTGKLDQAQVFYLKTRGYPEREAQRILVEGYFEAVLSRYPETILDEIHELVRERITREYE